MGLTAQQEAIDPVRAVRPHHNQIAAFIRRDRNDLTIRPVIDHGPRRAVDAGGGRFFLD